MKIKYWLGALALTMSTAVYAAEPTPQKTCCCKDGRCEMACCGKDKAKGDSEGHDDHGNGAANISK